MKDWQKHLVSFDSSLRKAMQQLDTIGIASGVLFVTDINKKLVGSVTDGDIRRALLKNAKVDDRVAEVMNKTSRRFVINNITNELIHEYRKLNIHFVPVVDEGECICNIINLHEFKEIIPVDVVIMAGGKGERLLPLTKNLPKPLLKIGNKSILEHNVDRLIKYGVKNFYISINYLGNLIEDCFDQRENNGVQINFIRETQPLGTIGSVSLVEKFEEDIILVMNADLLTTLDFAEFYKMFLNSQADMVVATTSHNVDLPYAILELDDKKVISLKEKPRYTYFANAGIYMIKKSMLKLMPKAEFYNATDLMTDMIKNGKTLVHYPIVEYWLDIGRMNDYLKAQEDIKHLEL